MVVFAPYSYTWSAGNKVYQVDTLVNAQKILKHNDFTSAFLIGDGRGDFNPDFTSSIPDLQAFVKAGGNLIISCGGASGPYFEDTVTSDVAIQRLSKVIEDTGAYCLDFDIEGAAIAMPDSIANRNVIIKALQTKFPNLKISFTLAVEAPSNWGPGGLPLNGTNFVQSCINAGIRVDIVNCMLMDTYTALPAGKTWGQVYI